MREEMRKAYLPSAGDCAHADQRQSCLTSIAQTRSWQGFPGFGSREWIIFGLGLWPLFKLSEILKYHYWHTLKLKYKNFLRLKRYWANFKERGSFSIVWIEWIPYDWRTSNTYIQKQQLKSRNFNIIKARYLLTPRLQKILILKDFPVPRKMYKEIYLRLSIPPGWYLPTLSNPSPQILSGYAFISRCLIHLTWSL